MWVPWFLRRRKALPGDAVEQAAALAAELHADQRYADQPYTVHLRAVVDTLHELDAATDVDEVGPAMEVAAWLHDALEDTPLTAAELEERFDAEVRALVEQLTVREGQRWRDYFRRMSPDALTVKLADRLANVRAIGRTALPLPAQRKVLSKYVRQLFLLSARADMSHFGALQILRDELNAAEQRLRVLEGRPVEEMPPEAAQYWLIVDRPVRVMVTPERHIETQVYDPETDSFVADPRYRKHIVFPSESTDADRVGRDEFRRRVEELRSAVLRR